MSWNDTEEKIVEYEVIASIDPAVFNKKAADALKRGLIPSGSIDMNDAGFIYQAFAKWSANE